MTEIVLGCSHHVLAWPALSAVWHRQAALPEPALVSGHRAELTPETDLPYLVDLPPLVHRSDHVGLSARVGLVLLDSLAQPNGLPALLVLVTPVRISLPSSCGDTAEPMCFSLFLSYSDMLLLGRVPGIAVSLGAWARYCRRAFRTHGQ